MSLILRQSCQPILDDNGFDNFHVEISNDLEMYIAGECGQPFCPVKGVKFSRRSPSTREVSYAAELLDAFMAKHAVAMRDFIDMKHAIEAHDAVEPIKSYKNGKGEKVQGVDRYGSAGVHVHVKLGHESEFKVEVLFRSDEDEIEVEAKVADMADLTKVKLTEKQKKAIDAQREWVRVRRALMLRREKAQQVLANCAI